MCKAPRINPLYGAKLVAKNKFIEIENK